MAGSRRQWIGRRAISCDRQGGFPFPRQLGADQIPYAGSGLRIERTGIWPQLFRRGLAIALHHGAPRLQRLHTGFDDGALLAQRLKPGLNRLVRRALSRRQAALDGADDDRSLSFHPQRRRIETRRQAAQNQRRLVRWRRPDKPSPCRFAREQPATQSKQGLRPRWRE